MWPRIKDHIKNNLGTQSFNTWFHSTELEKVDDKEIILNVPNTFYRDHIESHYLNLIKKTKIIIFQQKQSVRLYTYKKNCTTPRESFWQYKCSKQVDFGIRCFHNQIQSQQ